MRESVRVFFPEFSRRFEGYVHWMYLDVKGLVTIGIGNLINSPETVGPLPFTDKTSGAKATRAEILTEWNAIRARQDLKNHRYTAFEPLTRLRLSDDAIADLVRARLGGNEDVLRNTFQDWDSFPADAQLGVLSLAWAVGAAFAPKWPNFTAACRAADWSAAAGHCKLKEDGNPGVIPRNRANARLFTNAANVVAQSLDPERLYFLDEGQGEGSPTAVS
jgi:hypothetical protein